MVNTVHVWGDYEATQQPVQSLGDIEISVIEHGHPVENDLEQDDYYGRGSQNGDC